MNRFLHTPTNHTVNYKIKGWMNVEEIHKSHQTTLNSSSKSKYATDILNLSLATVTKLSLKIHLQESGNNGPPFDN